MHALNMTTQDSPNYLVLGAGVTGWSVVNYLQAQRQSLRVADTRKEPPFAEEVRDCVNDKDICFGDFNEDWALMHDVIVISPGVSLQTPFIQKAIQQGVEVIGDVELFARNATKPYIAITGSNGKSTVTNLV